jgi:hypothetical protein
MRFRTTLLIGLGTEGMCQEAKVPVSPRSDCPDGEVVKMGAQNPSVDSWIGSARGLGFSTFKSCAHPKDASDDLGGPHRCIKCDPADLAEFALQLPSQDIDRRI